MTLSLEELERLRGIVKTYIGIAYTNHPEQIAEARETALLIKISSEIDERKKRLVEK